MKIKSYLIHELIIIIIFIELAQLYISSLYFQEIFLLMFIINAAESVYFYLVKTIQLRKGINKHFM